MKALLAVVALAAAGMLVSGQARLERVLARFADRRISPFSAVIN